MRVLRIIMRLKTFSREYDDAIGDSFAGFDFSQEPSNYCSDDKICNEVNECKDSKKKVEKFNKTLINPQGNEHIDSFFKQFYVQSGTL